MQIDLKKVKGSVFNPRTPKNTSEYVVVLEKPNRYLYISTWREGKQTCDDLAFAMTFATFGAAQLISSTHRPVDCLEAHIVPLADLIKPIFRVGDDGKLQRSIAPANHNGPDWKSDESKARTAAVKRVKKKVQITTKKFQNDLAKLHQYLQILEPTSIIFMQSLEAEVAAQLKKESPNESDS